VNSPSASFTYNWSTKAVGGTAIGTGTSITTGTVNRDSTFYVAAVNSAGCVSDFTPVKVTILPAPAAPVVTGVKLCTASTAVFTVENPAAGTTYNWYASSAGGTVIGNGTSFTSGTVNKDTTFSVVAVSSASCRSSVTPVTVTFVSPPAAPVVDGISLCPGEPATLTVNNPQTGITYHWFNSAAGGTAAGTGTSFTFPFTGGTVTWYVTASSNSSCISSRSPATVTAFSPLPEPVVTSTDLGADKVTFTWLPVSGVTGYEVSVNGGPAQSPSSGATGTTHKVTGVPYLSTVTIKVIALGPKLCQNSEPGLASAKMLTSEIFIPNTFTPNADGKNDNFTVYGNAIAAIAMKIFNQWGELIFSTTQLGKAWDGTYKGKQQPVGIYVYAVSITLTDGTQVIKKGDINLIR
jgi:gliding motility-associated-like protein